MSPATTVKTVVEKIDPRVLARTLEEGYGPGAWHGPDLKAALADGSAATAFRRPGPARHNIAEIAMHHAWCVRSVATPPGWSSTAAASRTMAVEEPAPARRPAAS